MDQNPYTAPTAEVGEPRTVAAPLSLLQMFFSFHGRMRRGQYWGCMLGAWFVFGLAIGVFAALFGGPGHGSQSTAEPVLSVILLLLYPPLLWASFALQAKRWHDRNRSAWWALLGAVPLANIWVMIEVGFLAGTPGPNSYGPPPP